MSARLVDPVELGNLVSAAAERPGASRTLFLDVDGTIAPLERAPAQARVLPGVPVALEQLAGAGWTIAVISGRPWADARAMVPVDPVLIYGSHGAEDETGRLISPMPPSLSARLEALLSSAAELAHRFPGVWAERKPAGMALHHRMLKPTRQDDWLRAREAWLAVQDTTGLESLAGRSVLELRPRGVDKGTVARRLLRSGAPSHVDPSVVAIGDDVTDEDLFAAVAGSGISIRVGLDRPDSAATFRLASPAAVELFLVQTARLARAGDSRSAEASP